MAKRTAVVVGPVLSAPRLDELQVARHGVAASCWHFGIEISEHAECGERLVVVMPVNLPKEYQRTLQLENSLQLLRRVCKELAEVATNRCLCGIEDGTR